MIVKHRVESSELNLFRILAKRMVLSEKEAATCLNLEKGFLGEQKFDEWLGKLPDNYLIINDLLLEYNNTIFQIDSIVISAETIYLFEVKYYEGDYIFEEGKWFKISGNEIRNPLHQLERTDTLFRRFLKEYGLHAHIEKYVVFINPEFYLYQAPPHLPIIFPTQINRFINKLKRYTSELKERQYKLTTQLLASNIEDTTYKLLPTYSYETLKKGVVCVSCNSIISKTKEYKVVCNQCGQMEPARNAILRNVEEFQSLFPNRVITTKDIFEWCNYIFSKKTIRKALALEFMQIGQGKSSYYIRK